MNYTDISFSTTSVFGRGFQPGIKSAICVVGNLLNSNLLMLDGTISLDALADVKKHQIWSYVYYLWHYNRDNIDAFAQMTVKEGGKSRASAHTFLKALEPFVGAGENDTIVAHTFTKQRIVDAIATLLRENPNVSIPILQKLYAKLLQLKHTEVQVTSNAPPASLQSLLMASRKPQVQIINGNNVRLSNADIKVQFGINLIKKE